MLHLWDAAIGREIRTLSQRQIRQVVVIAPGPEQDTLLELSADNTLHVWDLTTGREDTHRQLNSGKRQGQVALSANGKRVAGWNYPDNLTVWDAATGKELFHARNQASHFAGLGIFAGRQAPGR